MMSFLTFPPSQYHLHGGNGTPASGAEQLHQVLEVRLRFFHRLIARSPNAGVPHQILRETPPIPLENVLFDLPLHHFDRPENLEIYVEQLLNSLSIDDAACVAIAWQVASRVVEIAAGDTEMNFHVVADVDYFQTTWLERIPGRSNNNELVEETMILEEGFPEAFPRERRGLPMSALERLRMEKLEEEELGDCSICLDEFDCKRREVVKIPCGHVYHQPCLFKWLEDYNSCPLCRRPLPLQGS